MAESLILCDDRLVRLAVFILVRGTPTHIEEELCLVQIYLFSRRKIQLYQGHFGNLVSRHANYLPFTGPYRLANIIGITHCYIQEVALACSLVICHSPFYHVTEIVQLMAATLYGIPTFGSGPRVWMLRVHSARRIEIAVRLLSTCHYDKYTVYIAFHALVRVRLEQITCPLYGFIYVCIVKRETTDLERITRMGCLYKVSITP